MQRRTIILAVLLLVMAGGAYYLANMWLQSQKTTLTTKATTAPAPRAATHVLVAARSLPAGEFLTPAAVRWQSWPDQNVPANYIVRRGGASAAAAVTGSVVRVGIAAGQPLTAEVMVKPGERGFLAAALWPGMRAISAPINRASGVSGLVFPGDRVDLILTVRYKVQGPGGKEITRRSSETILEDVRVIAIDQSMGDVPDKAKGKARAKPVLGKTATFELTPKQVEILSVAMDMGVLSLSLRSLSSRSAAERYAASDADRPTGNRTVPTPGGEGRRTGVPPAGADGLLRRTAADGFPTRNRAPTTLLRHKMPVAGTTITPDVEASKVFSRRSGGQAGSVIVVRGGKSERVPVR